MQPYPDYPTLSNRRGIPDLQGNPRAGARSCPNEFRRPVASRVASFFEIACFNHRFSYCIGGVRIQKLKREPSSGGICHPASDQRILALRSLYRAGCSVRTMRMWVDTIRRLNSARVAFALRSSLVSRASWIGRAAVCQPGARNGKLPRSVRRLRC